MTTDQTRDPRADLLDAIDSTYAYGVLGYDTPEALLAAYDATLSVPPSADRATLDEVRKLVRRLAAHAEGFGDVLDDSDRDPWAKTVRADIAALVESMNQAADDERPLSPDYEHPECGFHWHGRDGMDIPVRDGQPVCPRCELAKVEKKLAYVQRMRDEVGEECKRRGRIKLEQAERIVRLERELDGVRDQLGKEMLRADDAEAELRRLAAEEQPTETQDGIDLADRLEAALTERFTELGNPFSEMRRHEQGPDGWPASHPVGPNKVAEVLRELMADETPAERAAVAEQPDTQTREARPPAHRWWIETLDNAADEWAPGTRYTDRTEALERYGIVSAHYPLWKDGTPVQRRFVRETTSYTVEDSAP